MINVYFIRRSITSICVNEGYLYAGGRDGSIVEWDLTSGLISRTLSTTSLPAKAINNYSSFLGDSHHSLPISHSKAVTCICSSGSRLYSASEDASIIVWSIPTAKPIRSINGNEGFVTAVCISPEGRLFSGGADRHIYEWDPTSGKRLHILSGHARWVLALCTAGGRLYSGGNDHTVRVWDMTTRQTLYVLEDHRDWVFGLCLGRDLLYSCSRDGITINFHL